MKVWDAHTGKEVRTLQGHTKQVRSVAFSPDGAHLASGSDDNTVKVWKLGTGQEPRTLKGHTKWVTSVAFSPDGARLASGSSDRTVRLWDARTGQELRTLRGHTTQVLSVAFSPDGARLASGSGDNTVKIWDVGTGRELRALKGHTNYGVYSVAFSTDGARLVSGGGDKTVKIWDARTGQELRTLKGYGSVVGSVAFSPNGALLATGCWNRTAVRIWDGRAGQELRTLKGHTKQVWSVAFSADGARLASGSGDQTVKLWDARTGLELRTLAGHNSSVTSVAFSPDGQRLVSRDNNGETIVWDVNSGQILKEPAPKVLFSASPRSPDGRLFAWIDRETVRLIGPPDTEELLIRRARTQLDADWHRREAARWEKEKEWLTAVFHLENALRAKPDDGDITSRLTAALTQAAKAQPNLGTTWRRLALARLHGGQDVSYRKTCQQMQERFAEPGDDNKATVSLLQWQHTIRAAVLQPKVLTNPEQWLARLPKEDRLLRGAILCRAGKHADAVAELADVREPVGLLFRALAEHGRGDKAACRTALAAAKKLIPPDKIDLIEQTPLPWLELVEMRALLKELEGL